MFAQIYAPLLVKVRQKLSQVLITKILLSRDLCDRRRYAKSVQPTWTPTCRASLVEEWGGITGFLSMKSDPTSLTPYR